MAPISPSRWVDVGRGGRGRWRRVGLAGGEIGFRGIGHIAPAALYGFKEPRIGGDRPAAHGGVVKTGGWILGGNA